MLNTIRQTNVAEREAGVSPSILAPYKVNVDGKEIVFIDTTRHEAFTAMRARGALVTDIVILIVAADDGSCRRPSKPSITQRRRKFPIIVAINKIDNGNANVDKVVKDLSNHGPSCLKNGAAAPCSQRFRQKKKIGIQELLELIILQSEMLELKANPNKLSKGIVIESELDKGYGPVGTVIIQEGTLKIQDPFIAGSMFGRVRAMFNDKAPEFRKRRLPRRFSLSDFRTYRTGETGSSSPPKKSTQRSFQSSDRKR